MTLMMRDLENQEIGINIGFEQGMEQGIIQGIEQGVEREQRNRIEAMLRDGKSPESISDFCKYPLELVRDVQNSMHNFL